MGLGNFLVMSVQILVRPGNDLSKLRGRTASGGKAIFSRDRANVQSTYVGSLDKLII